MWGIIKSGSTIQQTRLNHSNTVFAPRSCAASSHKVANIRRQIASLDAQTEEALKRNAEMARINSAIFVFSIVKDTCIAFLDLAGAITSVIPGMEGASRTADLSLSAIQATEAVANQAAGQSTWMETSQKLVSAGVGTMKGDTLARSANKFAARVHTDGAGVVVDATRGNKTGLTAGLEYSASVMTETATVLQKAAEEAGETWAGPLNKGLGIVKVVTASAKYNSALENRGDAYLDEKLSLQIQSDNTRFHYRRRMEILKRQFEEALAQFEACQTAAGPPLT